MRLPNVDVYEYFIGSGISHLYHANTVATSITFIQQQGLLSRGGIESKRLYQTPQGSDEIDQLVEVWNDVFFDTTDLHGFFPRENRYGPISFKFSVDLILNENYHIWITKNNPQYWTVATPMNDRYFSSIEELRDTGDNYALHRRMILIKNFVDPIGFDFLASISIDNPRVLIHGDINLLNETVSAFKAIQPIHLTGKFYIRTVHVDCQSKCYCTDNYLRYNVERLARLFLPQNHIHYPD